MKSIPLITLVLLIACSPRDEQKQDEAQSGNGAAIVYACPMHPGITTTEPGSCPTCGMELVPRDSLRESAATDTLIPSHKIVVAKKMLRDAIGEMVRDGSYKCCIEVPCLQCALDHQTCPCYNDLKKGKPVCNECYGGWQRGEGKDRSTNPKDVKTTFSTHKH